MKQNYPPIRDAVPNGLWGSSRISLINGGFLTGQRNMSRDEYKNDEINVIFMNERKYHRQVKYFM